MNDRIIVGAILSEDTRFTLAQACRHCGTSRESVLAVVEEGLVQPLGERPEDWMFDSVAIERLRRTLRLQRQLELELPGVALALDLMEEVERLHRRLALLEHQLKR